MAAQSRTKTSRKNRMPFSFSAIFTFPSLLILVGTLLAAGGAFWTSYRQEQFEASLQEKQKSLEAKNDEIVKLNREIATLSHHTMNMVTGGDSFAYIYFADNQSDAINNVRLGQIFLTHEGKYPLYDLKIQIADIDAHKDVTVFTVGNIGSIQHVKHWPLTQSINFDLSGKKSQRFNIFFYGRNGTWFQQMIYKSLGTKWSVATRVVRSNEKGGTDVLFEEISPDYPIPKQEITWE